MGTKWGLSYVSYVIHTIHWILSPLPFFISLFQLRLVLFFVNFFLLFSLFLALPFQDCKGPITITKRRLSCAVYYSHYSRLVLSSSRSYPLLALVSHPARRVCGLRLFAACMFKQWHEALLLQLIFFGSGSLFSWTLIFGDLYSTLWHSNVLGCYNLMTLGFANPETLLMTLCGSSAVSKD